MAAMTLIEKASVWVTFWDKTDKSLLNQIWGCWSRILCHSWTHIILGHPKYKNKLAAMTDIK